MFPSTFDNESRCSAPMLLGWPKLPDDDPACPSPVETDLPNAMEANSIRPAPINVDPPAAPTIQIDPFGAPSTPKTLNN